MIVVKFPLRENHSSSWGNNAEVSTCWFEIGSACSTHRPLPENIET